MDHCGCANTTLLENGLLPQKQEFRLVELGHETKGAASSWKEAVLALRKAYF